MISAQTLNYSHAKPSIKTVQTGDFNEVEKAHSFLSELFKPGQVENLESFHESLSHNHQPLVIPKLKTARIRGDLAGVSVGAYLGEINAGIMLYSAVNPVFRRQGLYKNLRTSLVNSINSEAISYKNQTLSCMLSEVENGSLMHRLYQNKYDTLIAPCHYWQPQVQGLSAKSLLLVIQSESWLKYTTHTYLKKIIFEIYRGIYRITDPARNATFKLVLQSLDRTIKVSENHKLFSLKQ